MKRVDIRAIVNLNLGRATKIENQNCLLCSEEKKKKIVFSVIL